LRALIVVLWRGGLRIQEALPLGERDLDPRRASLLARRGKGGRRREIGTPRQRERTTRARSFANGGVACLMQTAVATSLTSSETDAGTDAAARPRPGARSRLRRGTRPENPPRPNMRDSLRCTFSMQGMSGKGHSRT
jgi:hypothetical protein